MKDLGRFLYRAYGHSRHAFGHFQRHGRRVHGHTFLSHRQSEIHFFVRYTFGIHVEKCMSCVVFLVNHPSCRVLTSHSRVMVVSRKQALRYAKKSPILIHLYPIKWVHVNAQRLEWKQALSFAFLQLATWIFSCLEINLLRFSPSSFCWAK